MRNPDSQFFNRKGTFKCFRANFLRNKSGYEIESLFNQKKLLESKSVSPSPGLSAATYVQAMAVRKMPKINLATILMDHGSGIGYLKKPRNNNYYHVRSM